MVEGFRHLLSKLQPPEETSLIERAIIRFFVALITCFCFRMGVKYFADNPMDVSQWSPFRPSTSSVHEAADKPSISRRRGRRSKVNDLQVYHFEPL